MERIYIEYDNARITRRGDDFRLDVELYSGERFESVEARRLFPTTGPNKYITLLDENGKETAVIRDLDTLMPESAAAVRESLEEYYLIPRIRTITKVESKPGGCYIHAETDRGPCFFKVQSRQQDIKVLFDFRVLIRDSNDNRYEIPDYRVLDRKSRDGLQL
jgi:hypothetical protein